MPLAAHNPPAHRMPLWRKGAAAAALGVDGSAAAGMSVATRPWWKVLLAAVLLLLPSAAGLLSELPSLLVVLLGAEMAESMLALRDSVPPACAAWLTQSSWNGFCSGRLLHLKQRSKLSNLQGSRVKRNGNHNDITHVAAHMSAQDDIT